MLATLTKAELQAYFERLFFSENRANRFDMHWNSQPHINRGPEEGKSEKSAAPTPHWT